MGCPKSARGNRATRRTSPAACHRRSLHDTSGLADDAGMGRARSTHRVGASRAIGAAASGRSARPAVRHQPLPGQVTDPRLLLSGLGFDQLLHALNSGAHLAPDEGSQERPEQSQRRSELELGRYDEQGSTSDGLECAALRKRSKRPAFHGVGKGMWRVPLRHLVVEPCLEPEDDVSSLEGRANARRAGGRLAQSQRGVTAHPWRVEPVCEVRPNLIDRAVDYDGVLEARQMISLVVGLVVPSLRQSERRAALEGRSRRNSRRFRPERQWPGSRSPTRWDGRASIAS